MIIKIQLVLLFVETLSPFLNTSPTR